MKSRTMAGRIGIATAVAVLVVAGASTSHGASTNTKTEVKCFDALSKGVSKHEASVAKALGKCRADLIAGKVNSCPDQKVTDAITKSEAKIAKSITAKCKSACSVSGRECIDDIYCPPNGTNPENCTAGVKQLPFHSAAMGFPGAACNDVLADPLSTPADFATCMADIGQANGEKVVDLAYGDVTSGLSKDAAKCASSIAKLMPKMAGKMVKAVSKCRNFMLSQDLLGKDTPPPPIAPNQCDADDQKTVDSLAKAQQKLLDTIEKKCTNDAIAELDLCGAGVGVIADVSAAQDCLGTALIEAAYSITPPESRQFFEVSMINAAYPDTTRARCGDNRVNQLPNQFNRMGEECDGIDASACPGNCLPPGDPFECTCSTHKRVQTFADGPSSDLDNGWSGASHNSHVADGAGFFTDVSNCDCDLFDAVDKATCAGPGHTSDPICDNHGAMGPRCNWGAYDGTTCDQHGNNNGVQDDLDCAICDQYSINAGDYCVNEGDCQSQCYDPDGNVTGTCTKQKDCTDPDVCRGRCDNKTTYCNMLNNGAPLPLSSQGTSVCVVVRYFTDVDGTRNIITGEHALNFDMRSVTFLAQSASRPCPICGGFCTSPSTKNGEICEGTCSGPDLQCRAGTNQGGVCVDDTDCPGSKCLQVACRFDEDCTGNGTCGGANSPECAGGTCNLSLLCAGGSNAGRTCRIESYTSFGTTSVDCPPAVAQNISGAGLAISYTPLTSETVQLENPGTCDTPGYELLNGCYCVTGGGTTRTQANRCAPSCTGASRYGGGCGGKFTKCAGGGNAGKSCDENADCGLGTCTDNPSICSGGTKEGESCTSDATCLGGGTCVDACPDGICTPFCAPKGVCAGGANDGLGCGVDFGCPGGTCNTVDAEEGVCPSGPSLYHCDGKGFEYRVCLSPNVGTTKGCESGGDGILGNDDDYVGAGYCVADVSNCFVNDGLAEGGDTLNGQGDPTNTKDVTVFCIPASSSDSVNATAGLPGPARLREHGLVVPNFTSLP